MGPNLVCVLERRDATLAEMGMESGGQQMPAGTEQFTPGSRGIPRECEQGGRIQPQVEQCDLAYPIIVLQGIPAGVWPEEIIQIPYLIEVEEGIAPEENLKLVLVMQTNRPHHSPSLQIWPLYSAGHSAAKRMRLKA